MEIEGQNWIDILSRDKEKAYRLLVNTYAGKVYNTCFRLTFHEQDAQDLTQEVFTAIYLSIDSYKGESKLSTWIYSIAVNKANEFIRYKMRDKRNADSTFSLDLLTETIGFESATQDTPVALLERKERIGMLFEAISELPENQRIAYTLSKLDGFSYAEISDSMGLSLQAIESLLFRAKQNLKKSLEKKLEG